MSILVSIIMSVKDGERFISQSIQSVIDQTYANWELLVFDDGSTDANAKLVNIVYDSRIQLFSHANCKGLPAALNFLVAKSKGELIARMDADDLMRPDRLALQVAMFENSLVDVVGSYAQCIDETGRLTQLRKAVGFSSSALSLSIRNNFLIHPTVMARKSFFVDNPYNDQLNRAEDYDLWLRTYNRYNFSIIPEALLFYRVYPKQYTKIIRSHEVGIQTIKLNRDKFNFFSFICTVNYFRMKRLAHQITHTFFGYA